MTYKFMDIRGQQWPAMRIIETVISEDIKVSSAKIYRPHRVTYETHVFSSDPYQQSFHIAYDMEESDFATITNVVKLHQYLIRLIKTSRKE